VSPAKVIFQMTLREAARRRILTLALALGGLMLALYWFALSSIESDLPATGIVRQQIFRGVLSVGMYPVNMLMVMMAAFLSADTLAGEIRSGVMQTMASKPVRRGEIVWGKWCAYAVLVLGYVAIVGGGVVAIIYGLSGYYPRRLPAAFAVMGLEGLLLLSVTMWASARLSTLAAGVTAIGLHGVAFLGGWIEEIGRVAGSSAAEQVGVFASVLFPSEALWRRAAYELQRPILVDIGAGPFSGNVAPSGWMVLYGALYAAAALVMAVRTFERRDL